MLIDSSDHARPGPAANPGEPEPIEAEFEPAAQNGPAAGSMRRAPRRRSHGASRRDMIVSGVLAGSLGAAGGAIIAIAVTQANSGAATGTLAQQLTGFSDVQSSLGSRVDQLVSDVVALRARVDSQDDAIRVGSAADVSMRAELSAISGQVSALAGLGGGAPVAGTVASDSPLGVLLSRLNRVETVLASEAAAPLTTRQMQRTSVELIARVADLDAAQTEFSAALGRRQLSLDALENGLEDAQKEISMLRAQVANASGNGARPTFVAAEKSRVIRALDALEAAADSGLPFYSQQQTLATLLPNDADIKALQPLARTGAAPHARLVAEFAAAARTAERLSAPAQDDGWDWWRGAIAPLRDGHAAAMSPGAQIIAARRALEAKDVRGAVEAIRVLEGAETAAFQVWLVDAELRAVVEERIQGAHQNLGVRQTTVTEG